MNKLKKRWNVTTNWQLTIIFIVFAITGSTAAYLSKPVTNCIRNLQKNLCPLVILAYKNTYFISNLSSNVGYNWSNIWSI